ncbi:MAG: DUF3857 domain-containing protein [Chlorobi bacterium]|nr:DUF3857 domain-containing protein [Chlorobiota bacterium]
MKKVILAIIVILLIPSVDFAQANYRVSIIPDSIKENAGSVIRLREVVFDINSRSHAVLKEKKVISILHESHRSNSYFQETYDEFTKISGIKIVIYDKDGKKVKTVPKRDILDATAFTESALFADIRQKLYRPDYYKYPFTIEYSFTKTYNGLLAYPIFAPVQTYEMGCERASYTIRKNGSLRYLNLNFEHEPSINKVGDKNSYRWDFKNIKPYKYEDYDLPFPELAPIVMAAPNDFEMSGYAGNSKTWEAFGKWIYTLGMERDALSSKTINEIHELTKNLTTKREKTKAVYEYMQSKTRYVNVIIGIGGWQPFPAIDVDNNGYGDCKGLSNYTHALLKSAGVNSYYTLIRAGSNAREIISDFPSNQFNHVIICVPDQNDTIWLECTSQRNPFGYIGSFTEGRKALIINENNSQLVNTPALNTDDNYRYRNAKIIIDPDGNAKADIKNIYGGLYYDNINYLCYIEGKRRMDDVRERIHIKNFSLNDKDYAIEETRSENPLVTEKYSISADRYVKKLGSRLLFNINFFNTIIDIPSAINKQESEVFISHGLTKIDSLEFRIPDGYLIKSYPGNDTLISDFGSFYTSYSLLANKLKYVRKQVVYKGKYPPEKYDELRAYLKKVSLADKSKVLIVPKD